LLLFAKKIKTERLAEIAEEYAYLSKTASSPDTNPIQIIFLQHQPYKTPWFIPRWTFTFNDEDVRTMSFVEGKDIKEALL